MIEPKDVVLAILGASAALAGFVLVFLGITVTSYQSYSGSVAPQVTRPYRVMAVTLYTTFCIAIGTIAVAIGWTLSGGADGVYRVTVGLFLIELVAVLASGFWALAMVFEWPRWR